MTNRLRNMIKEQGTVTVPGVDGPVAAARLTSGFIVYRGPANKVRVAHSTIAHTFKTVEGVLID